MKKIILNLLFVSITTLVFAQNADETAIKTVIEKETASWLSADADSHASCWAIKPYTRIFVSDSDGKHHVISAEMLRNAKQYMGGGGKSENSNYNIVVNNLTAWATYDQVKTNEKGEKNYSREVRMLEKIADNWKIVAECVFHYDPNRKD